VVLSVLAVINFLLVLIGSAPMFGWWPPAHR
jgi:hypothetical protein